MFGIPLLNTRVNNPSPRVIEGVYVLHDIRGRLHHQSSCESCLKMSKENEVLNWFSLLQFLEKMV